MIELSYDEKELIADLKTIPEKKDKLQIWGIKKWMLHPSGYHEWCTGTGKTLLLLKTIKVCEKSKGEHWKTYFVTLASLKKQTQGEIDRMGLKNVHLFSIEQYVKFIRDSGGEVECDLLVIDEVHRTSNKFSLFFNNVIPKTKYKTFCGASATLDFEHKRFLENYGIRCSSKFDLVDSRYLGLSPEYTIYNIPVELTDEEKVNYIQYYEEFEHAAPFFKSINNFKFLQIVTGILAWNNTINYEGRKITGKQLAEEILSLKRNQGEYIENIGQIFGLANRFRSGMAGKINVINNSINLINKTLEISQYLGKERHMIFCDRKETCNSLTEHIPNSIPIHSGFSKKEVDKRKLDFINGVYTAAISCKQMDTGFDDQFIRLIIRHSYKSKKGIKEQILGRVMRVNEENKDTKKSIMIHPYIEDFVWEDVLYESQQKKWLKSSLYGDSNVQWINNVNEIIL